MEKKKAITAELTFALSGLRCMGAIVYMDSESIGVAVPNRLLLLSRLSRGEEGSIAFIVKGILHRASVKFVSFDEGVVTCEFTQVEWSEQKRQARRVAICLRTAWRVTHSRELHSAWFEGVTEDISATGMRLIISEPSEIPHQIDAMLMMSAGGKSDPNEIIYEARKKRSVSLEMQEIRVSGRVKYATDIGGGKVALGVLFTRLSDMEKLRLLRFLADKVEEADAKERAA